MTHYVCTGECGGVSDTPKSCDDKACSMHDKPLVECHCTDGKHKEVLKTGFSPKEIYVPEH